MSAGGGGFQRPQPSLYPLLRGARAEGKLLPAASAPAMGRTCPSPQRAPGFAKLSRPALEKGGGNKAARNAASTSRRLREQLPFCPEGPPDPRPLPSPGRGRGGGAFGASGEAAVSLSAVRGCCDSTRPLCLGGSLVAPDAAASGAHGGSESMAAAGERSFAQMGLDARILQAVAELGWAAPTPIQEKAVPLALEGKDLLARARTGSGKTGAYALPLLQRLLAAKASALVAEQAVRGLVLVPTRELARQALRMLRRLAAYCARDVRAVDLAGPEDPAVQRPLLMEKPDVVIGTPSRVLAHLQMQNLRLQNSLEILVIDEADLLFSFGFEEDLKNLLCHLPKIYQTFIMSATFNEDVQTLKELVLHNAVTLRLQESPLPDSSQLSQFQIQCETEEDKFLLLYALLKLSLVRGKVLLFVRRIDRCYRLKLFLEQFGIAACVLNSELPVQSRCHIISQFNRGIYSYIIATDEQDLAEPEGTSRKRKKGTKGEKGKDQEYGVSRGIDFHNVSAVFNFDFPPSFESYIHRAGRTARVHNPGTVLTFVLPSERLLLAKIEEVLTAESASKYTLTPYQFQMGEIEGLRYRCQDAMRSVTKQAIKEAQLREIKEELLNSEKLKTYFEDNPRDLNLLRHDKPLHPAIVKPHLRNVPEYLVPRGLRPAVPPLAGKRKRRKCPASTSQSQRNPLHSFKNTKKKLRTSTKLK
ncbi:putative ATP-dependent RNA helicase DDX56 [Crotalus adamanteus]|uniref:Probable ATP-dependent RNA helicase DDX56 n=1 Tax=Crotalus adamanteus TaxID=8729 RepID=A0AAW1B0I2_CROAD